MKLLVEESDYIYCDIQDACRYLRQRDRGIAARFIGEFAAAVRLLAEHPELGRVRSDLGQPSVRSWRVGSFRNFLIFYEVLSDRLRLLRVLHGHRNLQAELGPEPR